MMVGALALLLSSNHSMDSISSLTRSLYLGTGCTFSEYKTLLLRLPSKFHLRELVAP